MSQQVMISTSKLNQIADLLEKAGQVMRSVVATSEKSDVLTILPKLTRPKHIPKGDEWFWSDEWQAREREVDEQIRRGEVYKFETIDEGIEELHRHAKMA